MAVSQRRLWKSGPPRCLAASRRFERPLRLERTHRVAAELRSDVTLTAGRDEAATLDEEPLNELPRPVVENDSVEQTNLSSQPLKINRDLLLYHARRYRRRGIRASRKRSRNRSFQRAESCFRQVIGMDPTDARAYVGLGRLYEEQGRLDEARRIYDDGCAISEGTNAHLWTSLGNLEAKESNFDRARACFEAAISANRAHSAAWTSWGHMEKKIGNYEAARDCWMKGIRYANGTPSPYLFQSLGLLAADLGLNDQARHWFKKGTETKMGARSYVIWTAWAIMEGKEGNRQLMQQLFTKSIELNSRGRYAYLAWGRFEQECGNVNEARKLLIKGHRKNPADPALIQALARLESECGRFNAARGYYEMSLLVDPKHQYSWQAWGVMELRAGNCEKARDIFKRGVWANPNSRNAALIFEAWGRMEWKLGNLDLARTLFNYGVEVDPRNQNVWDAWILLEEEEGGFERARELRSYSLQERVEITLPKDFSTLKENFNYVEEFFTKFSDWLRKRKAKHEAQRRVAE